MGRRMDRAAKQEKVTVVSISACQFHQKTRSGINSTHVATFDHVYGISMYVEKEQGLHCNAADSNPNLPSGCQVIFLKISFHRRMELKDLEREILTCILKTYTFISITHVFLNDIMVQNSERFLITKSQISFYKCNRDSPYLHTPRTTSCKVRS